MAELSASVMSLSDLLGIKLDFAKSSEATGVVVALCVRACVRACVCVCVCVVRVGGRFNVSVSVIV